MNTKTETLFNGENEEPICSSVRMLQGTCLATAILTFVFLTMGESNTEDLRWMILPYIFVPAAGGLGSFIFHLMQPMQNRGGMSNLFSIILSILVYAFLLVVGFVIGMNGPN